MRIGVVGGGINGVCVAWEAALRGHSVALFERGRLMGETSSSSSKLLHGGLRYLEQGEFGLVREALHERSWWLENAGPPLARPLTLYFPIYLSSRRGRYWVGTGLVLYGALAGRKLRSRHQWFPRDSLLQVVPGLNSGGLVGGYSFFDGQMDDHALGLWAAARALDAGVELREGAEVTRLSTEGRIYLRDGSDPAFDRVVNVSGPWAKSLLDQSGIFAKTDLSLVRGSHLVIDRRFEVGLMLEHPWDGRLFFVLPYNGRTLVGTTEVSQTLTEPVQCSNSEQEYLLAGFNHHFRDTILEHDILSSFAGVRPLVRAQGSLSTTSREHAIERAGALLTVFGGKWTTSRSLGRQVVDALERPT